MLWTKNSAVCISLSLYGATFGCLLYFDNSHMSTRQFNSALYFIFIHFLMQVAEEFIRLDGIPLLEAIQYNNEEEQRLRASYILDHYLHAH